ncbi:peptidase [Gardnerella sp. KA00255]|uniref:peptidase n=1 Tax=Gardnerella sp. KA00255 TaxID=2749073 RepID=UPI003BA9D254
MVSKSRKHARTVKLNSAVNNAIEKAVDARKVAAFTIGAAGVIAGAAFAFGATPAIAAEVSGAPDAKPAPVAAGEKPGADAGKKAGVKENDGKAETDGVKANGGESEDDAKKNQAEEKSATGEKTDNNTLKKADKTKDNKSKLEQNLSKEKKASTQSVAKADDTETEQNKIAEQKTVNTESVDNKVTDITSAENVSRKRTRRALGNTQTDAATSENQERASDNNAANRDPNKINPDTSDSTNTNIEVNENNAETMPNAYAWGSSDNTYSVNGEKHTVTFHFAKPKDGGTITNIAIFPAQNNGLTNDKSKRGAEYYSGDPKMHQSFSGNYTFTKGKDGSATLEMSTLFRDGNIGAAEKYAANRSIFVYVTKDGTTTVYKTNAFRAATLVPPKTAGSVVLKYNQPLTKEQVQSAITAAANAETARGDKKSVNDQIIAASKANGVNTTVNGKSTQVPDTLNDKLNVESDDAYDKTTFEAINKETSAKDAKNKTYVAGAKTLNTYMVTDLGFKSGAIPLTVARYDDRIDKPIVEDPTNVSTEVKEDIKKKLAKINGVTADKISFEGDKAVIHFDGVDEKDAPKIKLSDLVLKKLEEKDVIVPAGEKAVFVYNPLAYNDAEIARIKKAIYEANKENKELGLSEKDYENQISLSYLTGNLTATGDSNKGISNGQAENTITVKIKTDKAVAEFTSDVKARKLTKLPDIRKDYEVSWTADKIQGRDTDEGLSWSEDGKTIIYRYDPTAAQEFDTNKILGLLKATPKETNSGLRELTGGEALDHEGADGKAKKSHVGYVIDKNGQPTTELSLGNMSGAYWQYSQKVDNSGVDLGNEESNAGSYSWDKDAEPIVVAAKGNKVYKARLFVLPYGLTMYRNVYMENGNQPWNTPKAINVIFVPQTNHKVKDLKKSVDEHATTQVDGKDVPTQHEYYNASDDKKAAYDDALKKANDALKEAGDTEDSKLSEELKARIDNATIRLDKARAALDGAKTDKSKLEQDIKDQGTAAKGNTAASGTYKTDKYKNVAEPAFLKDDGITPDTKKNEAASAAKTAYDEALAAAEKVKADDNATQKAVDEAKAKLDAARKELDNYSTNKDKLNAAIAEHGKVKDGRDAQGAQTIANADPAYQNATDAERTAYDNAVKKANELSKDPTASQKEVNDAITALETAKKALDAKATNKAKLAAAVQQTFDNPDPDNFNGKKSTFYQNALNKKNNGSDDEKTKAAAAIKAYDDALKAAKDLLEDKNGKATQAQVDAAVKALTDAEDKLHNYSTDKNDLTKALADNIDGYLKPAYFNAFDKSFGAGADAEAAKKAFKEYNDAYHAAKELKAKFAKTNPAEQPTDEDCKKAKEALEKARQVIDTYATDTKKLSAAFWNDIAIQNSPAYKNAKALAVKTNPTDDEKAKVEAAKKIKQAYDDAVAKLHKAFENKLDKDPDAQDTKIPDAKGDPASKNYLDGIQTHANGEPLDRDVTKILKEMNDAAADLNQFATKTDKLQESINKDTDTQKDPAYKNAKDPHKLDTHGMEDTSGYDAIKEKATAYDNALNAAKDLLKNPDATQEDVNAALKTLDEARKALEGYKTNVEDLKKSVEAHGSTDGPATKEGTVTSDVYRNASDPHFLTADGKPDDARNNAAKEAKKAYDKALAEAQDLLKKADAEKNKTPLDAQPIQKEIDAALTTLNEKRKALDAYKTDTSKLDEEAKKSTADGATVADTDFEAKPEFKNAKAKTSNGVENTDVTAYKEALKKARELVKAANPTDPDAKNSSHPTQKQINDALDALKQAKKQIEDNYKTDASKLEEAKKYAEDVFKKTPEYKNALAKKEAGDQTAISRLGKDGEQTGFDNVLKKVTEKLNDNDWKGKVTQKFVDKLLEKLQEAQDNITKNYKTDVTPLSNEVGDKDQDGKLVVPPFEASVPYKNALAKKNAESEDDAKKETSATKKLEDYNKKLKDAQDLIAQVNSTDPNADPDKKPTQAQVDKALAALKKAKKDIDDAFKTKVDKLQNEVDDKNEDGTARTPKFEESTEFANLKGKTKDGKQPDDLVAYEQALAKAKELIDKNDGKVTKDGQEVDVPKDQLPSQKEVDEALKNLKEIKDKITKNYVTSPHDLQQEVDKSKDGDTDTDTSPDVFENTPAFKNATAKGDEAAKNALEDYNKKLKAAKDLLDKFDRATGKPKALKAGEKAPTQQELDKALKDLQDAKKKIEDEYSTVKYDLRQEAGKDSDFTKSPEYQNAQAKGDDESKKALEDYKNALDEANSVLADPNATQAEVDAALKKLQDAKSKLKDENSTDKSKLQTEADDDAKFRKSLYFIIGNKADIEAYKKALAEAKSVLNDPNATQAQVDEALRKLKAAKYKLNHPFGAGSGSGIGSGYDTNAGDGFAVETSDSQSASVDKSALQVEVNNAVDTSANTAAARAYRKALAEAKRVLADKNATQAQVDEALRKLQAAKSALLNSLRGASGNAGGLAKTGAETGLFASVAAIFAGLGVAGVASRRRKHSNE